MYIFAAVILMVIAIAIFNRKTRLRRQIRKIIKKHPNTVDYLKKGKFKRHELIKSLRGKIIDELSDSRISVSKNKRYKIIESEINRELKGWKGKVKPVILTAFLTVFVSFTALILISVTAKLKSTVSAK